MENAMKMPYDDIVNYTSNFKFVEDRTTSSSS